ncbi:MAG: DUF7669 domain-containing protein [Armatimonadota bacterium]
MQKRNHPYHWEMIQEAIAAAEGRATKSSLLDWIQAHYPTVNRPSVGAEIESFTVNNPSRIHYPENQTPRITNHPKYDILYRTDNDTLEHYDPERYGLWEIAKTPDNQLIIRPFVE